MARKRSSAQDPGPTAEFHPVEVLPPSYASLKPARKAGAIREMTVEALRRLGGVDYLVAIGREEPQLFMGLLGRVLPLQIANDPKMPLVTEVIHTFKSDI